MPPWLASTLLIVGGSALLAWLARKVDPDPRLAKIVLWSYGVRVVLTLCLFFISFWRLPILRSIRRCHRTAISSAAVMPGLRTAAS